MGMWDKKQMNSPLFQVMDGCGQILMILADVLCVDFSVYPHKSKKW
jgi:hypothetical protein